MITTKTAATLVLLLLTLTCRSQSTSSLIGAGTNGVANASSCISDEWSLFNNIAGLSEINAPFTAATYQMRSQLEGANRMAVTFGAPVKTGALGFGLYRMGTDIFNEQIISGGFSNKMGLASIGLKVNYIQYHAEGFGNKGLFTLNLGGIASLTSAFKIGAHITNINQGRLSKESDERLPTLLVAGISFSPSKQLVISSDLEKDLDYNATVKAGVEYKPLKKFAVRSGFNLYPNAFFLGIGIFPSSCRVNYAMELNTIVGVSHQLSVSYQAKAR